MFIFKENGFQFFDTERTFIYKYKVSRKAMIRIKGKEAHKFINVPKRPAQ